MFNDTHSKVEPNLSSTGVRGAARYFGAYFFFMICFYVKPIIKPICSTSKDTYICHEF